MFFSGISEVFSLASIIPFIAILVSPDKIESISFFSNIISFLNLESSNQILFFTTITFIVAVLISSFLRILNLWVSNRLVASIGCDISCEAYYKTLLQPYKTHISRNSSSIISTTTTETSNTVSFLSAALQLLTSSIVSLFIILSLLILNFKVALSLGFIFINSYLLIIFLIRKKLKSNSESISQSNKIRIKALQEGLGAIRDVILERAQEFYTSLYRKADYPLRIKESQNWFLSAAPRYILEWLGLSLIALLALFLTISQKNENNVLPLLGAFAFGAQRLLPSLQMVYAQWASMKSQTQAIKNVIYLLEQKIPKSAFLKPKINKIFHKSIIFKNIFFSYSNKEPVLKDINISFHQGEKIGIIGQTGSGKSTFLDILMGLIEPQEGSLFINNIDIFDKQNHMKLIKWQQSLSHVPQNIFLTDSSIAENIGFGKSLSDINFKKVKEAAKKAKIHDFITKLPKGYNTRVGERGVLLSGGQKQRIGIARAFYNTLSSIYIFDEATSALDENTEAEILKSIALIGKNKTVFMISHKPKTLGICDRIFKINDCKVYEV